MRGAGPLARHQGAGERHRLGAVVGEEALEALSADEVRATRVEVFRQPSPRGYRSVATRERGQTLAPLAFLDFTLRVDDVLG